MTTRDELIRSVTQQGQTGAWVEVDDNEEMVFVDVSCSDVPDLKEFVRGCHWLAGELGYGIAFNEARAAP